MDICDYNPVKSDEADDNLSWKHLVRQIFIVSSICVMFCVCGMAMGAPTVFIPQIRKEHNSTDVIDDYMFSWLTSMFSFAGAPWSIIIPTATSYVGRKNPFIFASATLLIASIIFYCSKNVFEILISEAMTAIVIVTLATVGNMVLAEYITPKYRGMFLTIKCTVCFWGIWLSNVIGTFSQWKNIPLVMIIMSIYPAIAVYFWPESPYYLANKLKYDECIKSQRWLKGSKHHAEEELSKLLSTRRGSDPKEKTFIAVVLSKKFYKATLLCICLFTLYTVTGKMACAMYSLDIIKKMTSSEKTAYTGMLILDGVTVFSMYVGSMLTRVVRRRVMLFSSTSVGIVSLYFLSLYVYLVNSSLMFLNKILSIALLTSYSVGIGCGPMIMSKALFGELIPLQYKSLSVCIISVIEKLFTGVVIKFTPHMIRSIELYGVFLFFAVSSTVCLSLLYTYMPETKDKTLFEISDDIQGKRVREQSAKTLI